MDREKGLFFFSRFVSVAPQTNKLVIDAAEYHTSRNKIGARTASGDLYQVYGTQLPALGRRKDRYTCITLLVGGVGGRVLVLL